MELVITIIKWWFFTWVGAHISCVIGLNLALNRGEIGEEEQEILTKKERSEEEQEKLADTLEKVSSPANEMITIGNTLRKLAEAPLNL